jgi:hypothetical protein
MPFISVQDNRVIHVARPLVKIPLNGPGRLFWLRSIRDKQSLRSRPEWLVMRNIATRQTGITGSSGYNSLQHYDPIVQHGYPLKNPLDGCMVSTGRQGRCELPTTRVFDGLRSLLLGMTSCSQLWFMFPFLFYAPIYLFMVTSWTWTFVHQLLIAHLY